MCEWTVIGISGVTCGGKTSLAEQLKRAIAPVHVFNQDKYFYPDDSPHHVKCDGLDHNNYDILSSLDMEQMYRDIVDTMAGDNKAHDTVTDVGDKFTLSGRRFMVIEGFTILNYEPINELCNLRYYLVLEFGACAARRALREYSPPDVAGYFERCAWPEHCRYRARIEKDSRVKFIDGAKGDAFDTVMRDLRALDT